MEGDGPREERFAPWRRGPGPRGTEIAMFFLNLLRMLLATTSAETDDDGRAELDPDG
jgi:hypothetical protein